MAKKAEIKNAKRLLRTSSIVCVLTISLLIYASGGPYSPFVVFFTMTFTLTLSQISVDKTVFMALGIFLIVLSAAYYFSYFTQFQGYYQILEFQIPIIIPFASLKSLVGHPFYFFMFVFGAWMSLIIWTGSILRFKTVYQKKISPT